MQTILPEILQIPGAILNGKKTFEKKKISKLGIPHEVF